MYLLALFSYFSDTYVLAELGQFSQNLITPAESTCAGSNERDLSSSMGPTRNQGATGWCFAYVAADLMSFKLGVQVSAADTAMSFYQNDPRCLSFYDPVKLQGGWMNLAIQRTYGSGACLESKFRSQDVSYWVGEFPIQKSSFNKLKCEENVAVRQLFPGLRANTVDQIYYNTSLADSFISNLSKEACKPRIRTAHIKPVRISNRFTAIPLFSQVDEQLRQNRPLGVSICSEMLYNANSKCSRVDHTVTIIGRRYNKTTKECEYLIRNSWGPDVCPDYDKKYKCNSANGNVWIPKSILRRSMNNVTYIP